jgi:RNA polymerase sigma factor (sigma-70 family)
MAGPRLTGALRYLAALTGATRGGDDSDAELLGRFVARRDEGAFAALLERHGPLVLAACRQVLGDAHDAEDAFQATFLVLARKAGGVRRQASLAAWLHRVALNIARTARADAARRRGHERQAVVMARATPAEDEAARDWRPLLHEEVDRLPEKYRAPVILCYFEEQTHDEAARRLAWPVGTVKGRLARARGLLRARLARRGLAPAAGVAALLEQSAARAAVPAALARSTLQAALQFAATPAAALASASSLRLAQGALQAMTRGRLVVAFLVAVAAAVGGGLLALRPAEEAPPRGPPAAGSALRPAPAPAPQGKQAAAEVRHRIVFVGDSSTDGGTYQLLLRQALARAGRPVPLCVNAGVSADTARGVRQRLERDVFVHRPTLVVFSAGVIDAIAGVTPAAYEADVRAVAAETKAKGAPLLLLTPGVLGPGYAEAEARLEGYIAALHRLAGEPGCRLADAHGLIRQARAAGRAVVEQDKTNPTFEGHRLIARALLDALGHADVPVPGELAARLLPGVLKEWRLRVAPGALDEQGVAALEPDGPGWTTCALPERGPAPTWWLEQERQRGFVLNLDQRLGKAMLYQGVASLQADRARTAVLHTGGEIQSVWLNGRCVHRQQGWTGWHPGKERLAVQLRAGRNVLVIETGVSFFLSVTDDLESIDNG